MSNQPKNTDYGQVTRWATNSGRTQKPTTGETESGWTEAGKVPSKKLNWTLDDGKAQINLLFRRAIGDAGVVPGVVADIISPATPDVSATVRGLARFGDVWVTYAYEVTGGIAALYASRDGLNWDGPYSLNVTNNSEIYGRCFVVTDSGDLVFGSSAMDVGNNLLGVIYGSTLAGMTNENAITIGVGGMYCLEAERGGDRIMLSDGAGKIYSAPTPGGSWYGGTGGVPPDGSNIIEDIESVGGGIWYALSQASKIMISSDDGETWAEWADISGVGLLDAFIARTMRLARNGTRTVACCVQPGTDNNIRIVYSDDGQSWTAATIDANDITGEEGGEGQGDLLHIGGSSWVLALRCVFDRALFLVSTDNGETWTENSAFGDTLVAESAEIGFDGNRVLLIGADVNLMGANNK